MKRLLIIGGGGFGREVLGWALQIPESARDWKVGGFLDDNPKCLDGYGVSVEIIGQPSSIVPSRNDVFVCAIGDPATKLHLCREMSNRGADFTTLIHPSAIMGPGCSIGTGSILCPGVVLTTNVKLGNFVTMNVYATVGHDAIIGDGSTMHAHSDVTGRAVLGEGVLLGSHASVLPSVKVGDYAVIGAGSVAMRHVPGRATVVGVPARQVSGFAVNE